VVGGLAVACGRGEESGDAAADVTPAVADTASPGPADTVAGAPGDGCPDFGLWQPCNVERRLERAGLGVRRRDEPVRHDFLAVEGIVWETSRAEVQVFLYASEADRQRDLLQFDTVAVTPRGQRVMWKQPATLVTSGNLAAIILSLNERQSERIALALGAGLPRR
jgi:hypothetical protein